MTQDPDIHFDKMLTPGDVAKMFNVDVKTVTRWAKPDENGRIKLDSVRTPGGHHRFKRSVVLRHLKERGEADTIFITVLHPRTGEVIHEQVCLIQLGQEMQFETSVVMMDGQGQHLVKMPVRVKRA